MHRCNVRTLLHSFQVEFIYRAHLKTTTVYQSDVQSRSIRTAIKKAIYGIKSNVRQAIKNTTVDERRCMLKIVSV